MATWSVSPSKHSLTISSVRIDRPVNNVSIEVEQTDRNSAPRRWITAVVAIGVLGAVGLISVGGTNTSGVPVTTLAPFDEQRLSDQIPGFDGTLHVTLSLNGIPTYARWAADAVNPELVELDTRGMTFNVDLSQVATISFIGGDVGDLRVGQPGSTRAVTPDVTSFVWHDTDPELVAMTRTFDDTSLWLGQIDPVFGYQLSSFMSLDPGSEVVEYGAWGFALHTAPNSDGNLVTVILDHRGAELFRIDGVVVGSLPGPGGGVMIADPLGGDVETTWGPALPTTDIVVGEEGLLEVMWSQDLMSYAQFSDGDKPGIDILYIRKGSSILVFEGYEPISWDSSGRFLATIRGATGGDRGCHRR